MSVSVSGLILPKVVFDLHVSVSFLFGPLLSLEKCSVL